MSGGRQAADRRPELAFVHCTRKVEPDDPGASKAKSLEPFMSVAESHAPTSDELIATLYQAVQAVEALFADARRVVAERVTRDGRVAPRALDREQRAAHGLAWLGTYVEALRQLGAYAERLMEAEHFGEVEDHIVRIGAGEYLAQILGGIPMSQGEIVRFADLGLNAAAVAARITPAVEQLIAQGNTAARRARLV